jgi:hypothetical protein
VQQEIRWYLRRDCAVIAGYGKRKRVQGIILSKIVAMEIETEAPEYVKPIKYKFLMEGGHKIELDDPGEIAAMRDILLEVTGEQGGVIKYI